MDLYQIRYFLAIAETGSFTRAAERLFVTQPSLSAGIRKLEKELGISLFERGGRKVLLTAAGEFFKTKAQNILAEYQDALNQLRGFESRPVLKLGALHTIQASSLAKLIGSYRKCNPHVTIELFNGQKDELADWLEAGKIDLAITLLGKEDSGKTTQLLFRQRLRLAVPQAHPFSQRSSLHLQDLDGQPYIQRVHCEILQACPQMFELARVRPHIVYWSDREDWVVSLVQVGLGTSIMPVWPDLPGVVYVPIIDLDPERTERIVGLRWRSQQDSEVARGFCHFATSHDWQV